MHRFGAQAAKLILIVDAEDHLAIRQSLHVFEAQRNLVLLADRGSFNDLISYRLPDEWMHDVAQNILPSGRVATFRHDSGLLRVKFERGDHLHVIDPVALMRNYKARSVV